MQLTFPDDRVKKSLPPKGGDTGSGSGTGPNDVDPTPQSTNEPAESCAPTPSSETGSSNSITEPITEPITSTNTGDSPADDDSLTGDTPAVGASEALETNEADDRQARVKAKRARARARAKARKTSQAEEAANSGGVDAIDAPPPDGAKKNKKRVKRRKASSNTGGVDELNVEELAIKDINAGNNATEDEDDMDKMDTRSISTTASDVCKETEPGLYNPDLPFPQRLEICIMRFREHAKLDQKKSKFFNEYLFLGGINAHVPVSYGSDSKAMDEGDVVQAHLVSSESKLYGSPDDLQYYDPNAPDGWSVDWYSVVAGYISEAIPRMIWQTEADPRGQTLIAIDVVADFLKYVLKHKVCEEYNDDVKKALELCDEGKTDMIMIFNSTRKLPSLFNEILLGLFASDADGDNPPIDISGRGKNNEKQLILLSAINTLTPPSVFAKMREDGAISITNFKDCDLEILGVHRSDKDQQYLFNSPLQARGIDSDLNLGYVTVEHRVLPSLFFDGEPARVASEGIDRIIMEDSILKFLKPGFFLRVRLAELNIGLKFMVECPTILPPFYTVLPQLFMRRYKRGPPRKPARTVKDFFDEDLYRDK